MKRFSEKFEGACVGHGPKHSDIPNTDLQPEINQFLSEYPFLQQDKGYVNFLERYAGATLDAPEGLIVIIFGFVLDIGGLHMTQDEGPIIDDEGFLCIAAVQVRSDEDAKGFDEYAKGFDEYTDLAFSFDATGERRPGIYRNIGLNPKAWYCEDFLTWLRLLIDKQGQLVDNSPDVKTIATEPE